MGALCSRSRSHVSANALENNVHTNMRLKENGEIHTTTSHKSPNDKQKQNINEIPDLELDECNQS